MTPPGVTGAKLVLEVERYPNALSSHLSNGVGGDGGISPVVGPVGPRGCDRPLEFTVRVSTGLRLQLREEPRDAICVLSLPRPRLDTVARVSPAALFVCGEGGAPDAPRGGQLGPVPGG